MDVESSTAAPMRSSIGSGGEVDGKAVAAHFYPTPTFSATDLAAALIAARFGLSPYTARLVVELSGSAGGR